MTTAAALLLALTTASLVALAAAEIQEFHVELKATSTSLQYTELYLRGPGSVDVSGLILTAVSEPHKSYYPATPDDDDFTATDDKADDDGGAAGDDGGAAAVDDATEVRLTLVIYQIYSRCSGQCLSLTLFHSLHCALGWRRQHCHCRR